MENPAARIQRGDRLVYLGEGDHYGTVATVMGKVSAGAGLWGGDQSTPFPQKSAGADDVFEFDIKFASYMHKNSAAALERVGRAESTTQKKYLQGGEAASKAGMNSLVFSRLAGSVTVSLNRETIVNVGMERGGEEVVWFKSGLTAVNSSPGLGVKFARKELYVVGFARQVTSTTGCKGLAGW